MVALGYKMAPPQKVIGLNHSNRWKIFKNLLLQNRLPQIIVIRFIALPGGLFAQTKFAQTKVRGSKLALLQGLLGLKHSNTLGNMKKNLLFQNNLAQMLENWYRGLHS